MTGETVGLEGPVVPSGKVGVVLDPNRIELEDFVFARLQPNRGRAEIPSSCASVDSSGLVSR